MASKMKTLLFSFLLILFAHFVFSSNVSEFEKPDWGQVETNFGTVNSAVNDATNTWKTTLDFLQAGSSILGPVSSIVSFAEFAIGILTPGPEEAILEKLEQLEKEIMDAFKRLGEKMDMGFNAVIHHIDSTDYRQTVIDDIRPLWEKFSILNKHPNMTDALNKFVKACEDHKPEETLGKILERISIEPSILTSLKKVSMYDWQAFESFSSSALQQLTQLQIVFGYCELIANNLTSINDSSSKEMVEEKLKKTAIAIHESEVELKDNFLLKGSEFSVKQCIDQHGPDGDEGPRCILKTMKERYPWTNFNLCKEWILLNCPADCHAKAKIDYSADDKYIITDLSRINGCPTGLCTSPICSWSGNNTFVAITDNLSYSNAIQETQRKPHLLPFHSKTYKLKPKRYRKRPHLKIEISEDLIGEDFVASFYTKKNYNKY
uniref:Uncharacterized protein n=1 Tax=Panagrolaimus sp. PS1159 TaxID=55785 RepID=A0AC35EXZ5_9BILA